MAHRERDGVTDRITFQQGQDQPDEFRDVMIQSGVHVAMVIRQPGASIEYLGTGCLVGVHQAMTHRAGEHDTPGAGLS